MPMVHTTDMSLPACHRSGTFGNTPATRQGPCPSALLANSIITRREPREGNESKPGVFSRVQMQDNMSAVSTHVGIRVYDTTPVCPKESPFRLHLHSTPPFSRQQLHLVDFLSAPVDSIFRVHPGLTCFFGIVRRSTLNATRLRGSLSGSHDSIGARGKLLIHILA